MERREALRLSAALMGTGLSGIVFTGMLQGCKVDPRPDWQPVFLPPELALVTEELAEHILPRTDTVGARDVMVHRFMDKLLAECFDNQGQQNFLSGLNALQEKCQNRFGKGFQECDKEERDLLLAEEEKTPYVPARYLWGNKIRDEGEITFYRQFKGLALFGYFSSEEVGKKVLQYDPIPGTFIGCIPLSEVGGSWAL